jgi:hypothetical protein
VPFVIVVVLALLLGALALATDGDESAPPAPPRAAPIAQIAAGVERARELRFSEPPAVAGVTPAQARADAAASLDADYPPTRRRADTDVLGMLGLVPRGFDLGKATLATFETGVAGYYDPRSKRLRVVEGASTTGRVLYEMTVAHELDHALEDQRFGLDSHVLARGGDRALAYQALVEGSATELMLRYADARFDPEEELGGTLASAFAGTGTEHLPPFLTAQLVFPYTAGQAFVRRLLEVGNDSWRLVDLALRDRPPVSTEQILHPDLYLRVQQPEPVSLRGIGAALGPAWRRLDRSTLGEWVTSRLLAQAGGGSASEAAAGWGGDAYALYGRGADRALVVRWRWDTPRDGKEFLVALRAWADDALPGSRRAGLGAWRTAAGAAALGAGQDTVTLVLAPDVPIAQRTSLAGAQGR